MDSPRAIDTEIEDVIRQMKKLTLTDNEEKGIVNVTIECQNDLVKSGNYESNEKTTVYETVRYENGSGDEISRHHYVPRQGDEREATGTAEPVIAQITAFDKGENGQEKDVC